MDTKTIIDIISSVIGSLAIIIGGIWAYFLFIENRQKYPRAAVKHQIIQKSLGNGKILLHVIVEVDNLGDVLVNLESGEIRLLQVLPIIGKIDKAIQNGEDPVSHNNTEIDWYQLFSRKLLSKKWPSEIEPKESDSFHSDFVINNDVQTVSIYSYFQNQKKKGKELGWQCSTIHDIEGGIKKIENMEESEKKILNQIVRPEPGEDEYKQLKPKPKSPSIPTQLPPKPPSEEKRQRKPKPTSDQKPKT